MALHVFLFFLFLCLAWLWHRYWLRQNSPHSRVGAIHTQVQRLRHRHAPHLIVRPAASPAPSRRMWDRELFPCAPGTRSKVGGEHRNG
jgi:hypothetical protein